MPSKSWRLWPRAENDALSVLVFPELCVTGYTCGDLFFTETLLQGALDALTLITARSSEIYSGVVVVGLPMAVDDKLFNCAAVISRGVIRGIVPKSFLPNYKEFYEARWFAPAADVRSSTVTVNGHAVRFGADLLFPCADIDGLIIGVEICEDLWMPIPPSCHQALAGATVLVNLSGEQ